MDKWTAFALLNVTGLAVGIAIAFFAHRFPSRGWVGIVLLLSAALALMLIDAGDSSRPSSLPMAMSFLIIAPVAVVYSFHSRRRAPDRLLALGAFVGGFIIGGFYLFMLAGLVMLVYEIFSHAA
jgi:hypothetical protein